MFLKDRGSQMHQLVNHTHTKCTHKVITHCHLLSFPVQVSNLILNHPKTSSLTHTPHQDETLLISTITKTNATTEH